MKKIFQFKIQIKGITYPPVWRRVIVPDTYTFEDFHYVIQKAFGWSDTHLFQFFPNTSDSHPTIMIPYERYGHPVYDARILTLKEIFHTEKQKKFVLPRQISCVKIPLLRKMVRLLCHNV